MDEDALTELALENDAEDVVVEKEHYEVICETGQYDKLADAFCKAEVSLIHPNWPTCLKTWFPLRMKKLPARF